MRLLFLALLTFTAVAVADIPVVPKSLSPDGKIHAVMDVDRIPTISPEWKGDSFPQIEITHFTAKDARIKKKKTCPSV